MRQRGILNAMNYNGILDAKMDLNQNGWASATPKLVAKDDEIKATTTHASMHNARGSKPKAQDATLQEH